MQRVHVYRNLRKHCWSVMVRGRVVRHAPALTLTNCVFRVREGGRQRCLRERKKFVHAFVVGVEEPLGLVTGDMMRVSYSPFRGPHFYQYDNDQALFAANRAVFTQDGKVFAN